MLMGRGKRVERMVESTRSLKLLDAEEMVLSTEDCEAL
jgi:hypothetical protein